MPPTRTHIQTQAPIHSIPVIFTKPQVKAIIKSHPEQVIFKDPPKPTPTASYPHHPKKAITSFHNQRIITQEALHTFIMGVKDYRKTRHENFTPEKIEIPHSMKSALNIEKFGAPVIHPSTGKTTHKYKKLQQLVLAQDVHFFYTRSHLSALKNCALIFSTNFQFIFTFK